MPDKPVIKTPVIDVIDKPVIKPPVGPLKPVDETPVKPVIPIPVKPVAPVTPVIPVTPVVPVTPSGPAAPTLTTLVAGRPVTTFVPTLLIASPGTPGTYTYSLTVVDDLGVTSKPATIQVAVTQIVIQ